MPRASSTRRSVASGSINTSRGNRSQAGPSSSRRRAADSADEEEDSELRSEPTRIASGSSRLADARAEEEVDHQSDEVNPADQIRNALEDWETKTHPFMGSDCAMVTQSLLQDGSAVRVGIETVLSIIADCAEKRAELEFVDDEAGMRHDEVLQDLDNDTCDLIDLRSKYALRQTVLKEMHDNVSGGDEYVSLEVLVHRGRLWLRHEHTGTRIQSARRAEQRSHRCLQQENHTPTPKGPRRLHLLPHQDLDCHF